MSKLERLVPEIPFPPYSYVPGHFPHPFSDPEGHSFGVEHPNPESLTEENWRTHSDYLFGCDLFNHGYFWEAHEFWEGLWHAAGRKGITADFLKGLIKLAAAGVKARESVAAGIISHANRAAELFQGLIQNGYQILFGLEVEVLHHRAKDLESIASSNGEGELDDAIKFFLLPDRST